MSSNGLGDRNEVRKALHTRFLAGDSTEMSEPERALIDETVRSVLAGLTEGQPEDVTDDTRLLDDLGIDSLALLEFFEEFQAEFSIDLDVNAVVAYAVDRSAETVGEFRETLVGFLGSPEFREALRAKES